MGNQLDRTFREAPADLIVEGQQWEPVSHTSSKEQGFIYATRRLRVNGGWLYQVNVYQRNPDRSAAVAVSTTFVPEPANANVEPPKQPAPPAAGKKPADKPNS